MTTLKSLVFAVTVFVVVGAAVSASAAPLSWTVDASGPGEFGTGGFFPGEWRAVFGPFLEQTRFARDPIAVRPAKLGPIARPYN